MIEVELRGVIKKTQYDRLLNKFKKENFSIESDDKIAYYYEYNAGILKLVDETSKHRFKISHKLGDECKNMGLVETEAYFASTEDLHNAKKILKEMGFKLKFTIPQQRLNIIYHGVNFSLKYTPSWKYHFEAEILVDDAREVNRARQAILEVCKDLEVRPFTELELQQFLSRL